MLEWQSAGGEKLHQPPSLSSAEKWKLRWVLLRESINVALNAPHRGGRMLLCSAFRPERKRSCAEDMDTECRWVFKCAAEGGGKKNKPKETTLMTINYLQQAAYLFPIVREHKSRKTVATHTTNTGLWTLLPWTGLDLSQMRWGAFSLDSLDEVNMIIKNEKTCDSHVGSSVRWGVIEQKPVTPAVN